MKRFSRRTMFIASAIAAIVALPLILVTSLIEIRVHRAASQEATQIAQDMVRRIDQGLERARELVSELRDLRVTSCADRDVQRLRRFVFSAALLKEAAVLDTNGSVLCNNLGEDVANTRLSMPVAAPSRGVVMVTVAAQGPRGRALRLIMPAEQSASVSAVIALDHFVPFQLTAHSSTTRSLVVTLGESSILLDLQGDPALQNGAATQARAFSGAYPIVADVTVSIDRTRTELSSLIVGAYGFALMFSALGVTLVCMAARRTHDTRRESMERALRKGEFVPFFQPIIDLETGALRGCEVLVRWRKPDGTMVPPGAFIDYAERCGFIFPLTIDLMRQVCRDVGPVLRARPEIKCAFNLCARHFDDASIVDDMRTIFGPQSIPYDQVVLEVTERLPLPDLELARSVIGRMQDLGLRVALDDVGTGHGGMSYLLKLGVDIMKIDKLFVDALGSIQHSTAIIDSLLDLAAHMRMDVVAEGVETFEQVEALRRRGVRQAQGFIFSPPLPASSFVQLVHAMVPAEALAHAAAPARAAA